MKRKICIVLFLLILGGAVYSWGTKWAKIYLLRQAQNYITDACTGCQLEVNRVSFRPLRGRLLIENIRVSQGGRTTVEAEQIIVKVKITKLLERTVDISSLTILNAAVYGLKKNTANYELLEHILQNDQKEPAIFQAKFRGLVLKNLSLHENLAGRKITLQGLNSELRQNGEDSYSVTAWAADLKVDLATDHQLVLSDRLELKADFSPDSYHLEKLTIERLASSLKAALSIDNGIVTGKADYILEDRALNLSRYANFQIRGDALLQGTTDEAIVFGSLGLSEKRALLGADNILSIEALKAKYNFSLASQQLKLNEFDLSLESNLSQEVKASITKPFVISPEDLDGIFEFQAQALHLEGITLKGISIEANLNGNYESPFILASAQIAAVKSPQFVLPDLQLEAQYQNQNIAISLLHEDPKRSAFKLNADFNTESHNYLGSLYFLDLDLSSFVSSEFSLPQSLSALLIDGSLAFDGSLPDWGSNPLDSFKIAGEFGIRPVFYPTLNTDFTINYRLSFAEQNLNLDFWEETALMLKGQAVLDFNRETAFLTGQVDDFDLASLLDRHACIRATSDFRLSAPLDDFVTKLAGRLSLSSLRLGCDELSLELVKPVALAFENGVVKIESFELSNTDRYFILSGHLAQEELQLSALGLIDLEILSDLVPVVDDLRGILRLSATVSGTLQKPEIEAEARLTAGEVAYDELDVWIREIEGEASFSGRVIEVQEVSAVINGGSISAHGQADLESMTAQAKVNFEDVFLQPAENLSILLEGELLLETLSALELLIQGEIEIQEAVYERELDLRAIIRDLRARQRAGDDLLAVSEQPESQLEIQLDLMIRAPGEIFIITNWLGAELEAQVNVSGTARQPLLQGQAQTITGWFIIGEHRFEVTSGLIGFSSQEPFPRVEIFSESYLRRPTAEDALVTIEIVGQLPEPQINVSSDLGLSQEEIFDLLTGGRGQSGQAIVNIIAEQAGVARIELLQDIPLVDQILGDLQILDSLTFEPRFNVETGQIEPAVRAEKSITPRLTLWSEIQDSEGGAYSRLQAVYELSNRIELALSLDRETPRDTTPVSFDIIYTFYDRKQAVLDFKVRGNNELSDEEVRRALFLSPFSRLEVSTIEQSLNQRLTRAYQAKGFYNANFEFECVEQRDGICRELHVKIEEGARSKIHEVTFAGDNILAFLNEAQDLPRANSSASADTLDWTERRIRSRLTEQGYYSSRVRGRFESIESVKDKRLEIIVRRGKQMFFNFSGNYHFSDDKLMQIVQEISDTTAAFSLERLRSEILTAYQLAGYSQVDLRIAEDPQPESELEMLKIHIQEGPFFETVRVRLEGNTLLSEGEIRREIRRAGQDQFERIFEPDVVFEPQIALNLALIEQAFLERGFLQTQVEYALHFQAEEKTVTVVYQIIEAPRLRATHIDVRGFPEILDLPKAPQPPHTQGQVNAYMQLLAEILEEEGFFSASMASEIDANLDRVILYIEPGTRTHISEIVISGLDRVDREVVLRALKVAKGEPWRADLIDESRRNLVRLGIFSRAHLRPEAERPSGASEKLLVELSERALRELKVGTGLNSEYGIRFFVEGSDRSLFGDGKSLYGIIDAYSSATRQDFERGVAALRYSDPFFLDTRLRFTEEIRFERLDVPTPQWNLDRWSGASYFHQESERGLEYSFGHSFLNDNMRNVSPDTILSELDTGTTNISYLSTSLRYNQRDDRFYARRGYLASLEQTLALSALLSDANFYGVSARFSYVYPVNEFVPRISLATSTRLASMWAFAGTKQIPITQRYYLGGRNTIRGFRENSLGPRGELGGIIGGDILFAQNLELRYERWENMVVHTFLDIGNVFLRSDSLDELRYSAGAGFRFLSPLGPVGFDLGIPLDEKSGEPSFRIHFNIGGTF